MTQLERLLEKHRVKIESTMIGPPDDADEWQQTAYHYRVTLRMKGRQLTTTFFQGPAHTSDPTAADVLSCLVSDSRVAPDFHDFCQEFGYDEDSRKAERIHRKCLEMAPKVRRFLGDLFDEVSNAEH